MSQVLSGLGIEPGAYAQFIPSTQLPNSLGGLRVLALVGTGITNATVVGEVVTKGSINTQDGLVFDATALPTTITDQNFVTYDIGTDYQLTSGNVDWSLANPAIQTGTVAGTSFVVNTLSFELIVGGVDTSFNFSGSNPISFQGVANQIVASISGITVLNSGNKLEIETTATDNTTLQIGNGTANSVLGFTAGILTESSQEPLAGVKYTLNYSRAKVSGDYVPKLYFDVNSVIADYGPVAVSGGNIVNSLSAAALVAFTNGASVVMGMQIDPSVSPSLVAFQQAIDKLQTVDLDIVVALNPDPNLQSYIKNHVDNMSSIIEQRFRTALVGLSGSPSISTVQTYAAGLKDRRVALVYPPVANMFIAGNVNSATVDGSWPVDGTYIAAAIGGIRVNPAYDVAEPLLRKQVFGFASIQDTLLRTQKNVLANSGVMIVENQNGVAKVRDGLTTDLTTADSAEYSVTEIIDFTAGTCRKFLEAAFIGVKLLKETPGLMQASLTIILQSLIDNKILNDATNINVVRNAINPTQIDVSFQIAPVFPVKYILVSFTI